MFWVVAIVILAIICGSLGEGMGAIAVAIVVIGAALLLISWILDVEFFATLATLGVVILIIIIVVAILKFIFSD